MTLEALDDDSSSYDEIDVIVKSIPLLVNNDEVKVEENGTNGIGWFNFSYRVQKSDSKSTCNESVPFDNSTDQPLALSSSSLWALIAVAILLLLTLLVTIIIAICIVRNMSMKLKGRKRRNAHDRDGERTCTCVYRKSCV